MIYRLHSKHDYIFAYDLMVFLNTITGIPEDNMLLQNHSIIINDEELVLHVKNIGKNIEDYKSYLKVVIDMFSEGYNYED